MTFKLLAVLLGSLFAGWFPGGGMHRPSSDTSRLPGSALLARYVSEFNRADTETVINYVPNRDAFAWLRDNIPYFECPDPVMEEIYYYRWWTFRKHLVHTPEGFLFTEFITPVSHAGKYNSISCALGHHIYEGRWLRDPVYVNQAIHYWLLHDRYEPRPVLHKYSSWLDDAVYQRFLVNRDTAFIRPLVPLLDEDYRAWEAEKGLPGGMYWQYDVRDGMEESIGGSRHDKNIRPTINSYMFGNARALARMAAVVHIDSLARIYTRKSDTLKREVETRLWNHRDHFFEVLEAKTGQLCGTREEIGFIPWYFGLPDDSATFGVAWDQLRDTAGFRAPWGITTAERRSPFFRTHGTGDCEWDGAVWPFATTQTLIGLANLLDNYHHHDMRPEDYFRLLMQYAHSMQKNGRPFIGEYQDGATGYWLKGYSPRSKYYNHSCFADLVITGLVGLRPRADDTLDIRPLVPAGTWDWFCLDGVAYHGHLLRILWDRTGRKYGLGKGFRVYEDGRLLARSDRLKPIQAMLYVDAH